MIAKTETLGGCRILRVSGRIDFESALDFEHHINAMIQEAGDCFIIELSQVELLSSAGLRVMLSTAKRVAHRNASLALAAPSQVVRQVFEISHFNLLFKIFPSVAAAITALKGTTEVDQTGAAAQDSLPPFGPDRQEETNFADPVIPSAEPQAKSPTAQRMKRSVLKLGRPYCNPSPKIESGRSEPLPPVAPRSVTIPPSPTVPQTTCGSAFGRNSYGFASAVATGGCGVGEWARRGGATEETAGATHPASLTPRESACFGASRRTARRPDGLGHTARGEISGYAGGTGRGSKLSMQRRRRYWDGGAIGTGVFRPDYKSRSAALADRSTRRALVCFHTKKRAAPIYPGRSCAARRREKGPAIRRAPSRIQRARVRFPSCCSTT